MNDLETAWVAGLLEGEGSFTIAKQGYLASGKPKKNRQLNVTCGMTDRDVIDKLHRIVGMGGVFIDQRSLRNPKFKTLYTWRLSRRAHVEEFLLAIRPHMGARRTVKINELLDYIASHPSRYGRPAPCGTKLAHRRGCRCDPCREAARAYARAGYWRRKEKLGEVA